jgi:transcription initiation factor TFIIIB Brf1 subunit/transcription initiation factor TFIIB
VSTVTITCHHSPTEIDGEHVCIGCGQVLGYLEVQSINSWQTHDVGNFNKNGMSWIILKLADNLNLPQYAAQTIMRISLKLVKLGITKKKAIFFATMYACRIHKIPRLLSEIFHELEKSSGKTTQKSEQSLFKMLNRIAKKTDIHISIQPPDKEYYLQAYLAKIQNIVVKETNSKYFELIRTRSVRNLSMTKADPSTAARKAILACTSSILQSKVKQVLA